MQYGLPSCWERGSEGGGGGSEGGRAREREGVKEGGRYRGGSEGGRVREGEGVKEGG